MKPSFALLTFTEADGAPIDWEISATKDANLVAAARAAGFREDEVGDSPVGVLTRDWHSFRRGARALVGDNGSTLLEVMNADGRFP